MEKPFVLFVTSKPHTERFVGKWQIDNFRTLFCWKQRLSKSGNWIVFFLKEKITLKHLKIVRSSDPRVRLLKKSVPHTHYLNHTTSQTFLPHFHKASPIYIYTPNQSISTLPVTPSWITICKISLPTQEAKIYLSLTEPLVQSLFIVKMHKWE